MTGQGGLWQRPGSPYWWMYYSLRGKQYRESTRVLLVTGEGAEVSRREAEKVLRRRLREVGADIIGARDFITPKNERVTVSQILDELVDDLKIREKYSKPTQSHLKAIRAQFGDHAAVSLNDAEIRKYIQKTRERGVANATINRRTQLLGQAYGLAGKRVGVGPKIIKLSEADNVRHGFLDLEDFERFVIFLPNDIQDFARWAYSTGWRKGTISRLEWSMVDFKAGLVTAPGRITKNGEPVRVPLQGMFEEIMRRRWEKRSYKRKNGATAISKLVFYREPDGSPVGDIDKAWITACRKAGLERFLFHDLRRSAVRNLRRANIDETDAMKITGHKTVSVFHRYDIRDNRDLEAALTKLEAFYKRSNVVPFGSKTEQCDSSVIEIPAIKRK
jgi:integrase